MKTVSPQIDLPSIDKRIVRFWNENNTFQKSINQRRGNKSYLFYDGPPFSSGLPHYGHLLVGTIKDIIPRFQTMRGLCVERRFGWDTHGLPIEMIIEKELGLKGRTDILEHGISEFNEACRAGVLSCVKEWEVVTERLGRWVDFKNDYKTMDRDFMESVWWVFKQLWDKDRIYEGARVMPFSWRLSTPLSNFEASSNYKTVQDPAVTVRFKLKDKENTSLLVWTTTPWTLPSNMGLCVGREIDYVEVELEKENIIIAKSRVEHYFGKDAKIISEFKGSTLKGKSYLPPFDYFLEEEKNGAFVILNDDYVSTDDGTGIVHQSPAHGEDDFRIGKENGIPLIDPVDNEGNFTKEVPEVEGVNIKVADKKLIEILKEKGLLFRHDTLSHSYPFCERSDTPLIYKAISAWYVKVEDLRDQMLENNSKIHWIPEHIKDGRFGKWLENARDWNISRNRFWGNPLPVWKCSDCDKRECMGSKKELEEKCGEKVEDLHKHFVDKLSWKCDSCSGTMNRIPEVLDCWFESGSMPYAQLHYPFENKEAFEASYPADFITESLDQTRGWFYTLMVVATSIFEKAPFKNCVVTGMILAEDGKKMSKRLKNYPDPMHVIETYGADALRLYLINSPLVKGESLRFSEAGLKDIVRTVLIPFWNVYSFFTTYANVDDYKPSEDLTSSENILDRWIISRFQTLVGNIHKEMDEYRLYAVVPILLEFLEELTNWYLRRSRRRFWSDNEKDKNDGYNTIFYILNGFTQCLAPFLPFMTEKIFENLSTLKKSEKESVHLTDYPIASPSLKDQDLEDSMKLIQKAVGLGRTLRAQLNIRTRQPLQSITVVTKNEKDENVLQSYGQHIKDELNVKEVLFSDKEEDLIQTEIKPNFPVLGPKLGKRMGELSKALKTLSEKDSKALEDGKEIELIGLKFTNKSLDIIKKAKSPDQEIETSGGVTVFYDTNITDTLAAEGIARELVNRIQRMRKEADYHVSDRINVQLKAPKELQDQVSSFLDYIKHETLSLNLDYELGKDNDLCQEHSIEGQDVELGICRA